MSQATATFRVKPRSRRRSGEPSERARPQRFHPNKDGHQPSRRTQPAAHGSGERNGSLRNPRQTLLAIRRRLQGEVTQIADNSLVGQGGELNNIPLDTGDQASDNLEQHLTLSLLGGAEGELDQIDAALQRIDEGTYGQCEQCGIPIPAARLEAIPYTSHCVECAARAEREREE